MPLNRKTKLTGVSFTNTDGSDRQKMIDQFINAGDTLFLEREPNNAKDKNAIAVFVETEPGKNVQVGYLTREVAADFAPLMDSGWMVFCTVLEKTGEYDQTTGVNIDIDAYTKEEFEQIKINVTRDINKKKYGVGTARAMIGIFSFILAFYSFTQKFEFAVVIMFLVFFGLGVFLLFPWVRWMVDKVKKRILEAC